MRYRYIPVARLVYLVKVVTGCKSQLQFLECSSQYKGYKNQVEFVPGNFYLCAEMILLIKGHFYVLIHFV